MYNFKSESKMTHFQQRRGLVAFILVCLDLFTGAGPMGGFMASFGDQKTRSSASTLPDYLHLLDKPCLCANIRTQLKFKIWSAFTIKWKHKINFNHMNWVCSHKWKLHVCLETTNPRDNIWFNWYIWFAPIVTMRKFKGVTCYKKLWNVFGFSDQQKNSFRTLSSTVHTRF